MAHPAATPSPRARASLAAVACLLGLAGLVSLKLWVLARILMAHFSR